MFEWKYTNKANADKPFQEYDFATKQYKFNPDGTPVMHQWKSYDNKWVRRNPVDKLPELRINEILNSFGKAVDPLFEMNIPPTWWCDIETEVSEDGFPDPIDAPIEVKVVPATEIPADKEGLDIGTETQKPSTSLASVSKKQVRNVHSSSPSAVPSTLP